MKFTTFGRTGLKASVVGLGCGGFSRLGLSNGKTDEQAADIVRTALDLGVTYLDTAESYGTEPAVGLGISGHDRSKLVIATKGRIYRKDVLYTADQIAANVDASLRNLRTDYIDIYQPHGPRPDMYEHMIEVALPVLIKAKEAGKIRHLGLTENGDDIHHDLLLKAAERDEFEVMLVAFHMMHQNARDALFPQLQADGTAVIGMYAVRNMFARMDILRERVAELCAAGQLPAELAGKENPLDFLIHERGAESVADAAYRFARHEPGMHVVVFGTGNADHVRSNVRSILRPPLPADDVAKIHSMFGHLVGVGLDATPRAENRVPSRRPAA